MPTQSETTSINLQNDITIVTDKGIQRFKKGQNVTVPRGQAEDISRMDYEHSEYQRNLHTKRTSEANLGSMAVGSGSE